MKKILPIFFLLLLSILVGLAEEIAIPNIQLVGHQPVILKEVLLVGTTNAVQPDNIRIEMAKGSIITITASYPKGISLNDVKLAVDKELDVPAKKFVKESGGNLFEWRNDEKHIAAMFTEKSVEEGVPFVLIQYIGKPTK